MNNLEQIFAAEKAKTYSLKDKDQFVFDTLTAISMNRERRLKRLLILLISIVTSMAVIVQIGLIKYAGFDGLVQHIETLMSQRPYVIAVVNMVFVAAIVTFKRSRWSI